VVGDGSFHFYILTLGRGGRLIYISDLSVFFGLLVAKIPEKESVELQL
jgi:hypothetical protein